MPITFILNDENKVNSYGFKTLNKGLDLKRFKDNPVILDDHYNSTSYVIGRWTNIRIEENQLKADAEFDTEDEKANAIAGKVERGFLKGCSMGLSFNRENMKQEPDGSWVLAKSEIFEASIVAIPSNANALKLYKETGELMSEDEIKLSIQEVNLNSNINQNPMKKILLSVTALSLLGLKDTEDVDAVGQAVEKMTADLAAANQKLAAFEQKEQASLKSQAEALVDKAIEEGKLTADVRDNFIKMALSDFDSVKKAVDTMPKKVDLGGSVNNPASPTEVKTVEDFQKLSVAEQLAFKADKPEEYKKLFA